jgi:hydrogenase maturation protease
VRTEDRTRPLVVGVGNRHRGDDGIGPYVADLVGLVGDGSVETAAIGTDLSSLVLRFEPDRPVVVIDAMASDRQPGTVEWIDGSGDGIDRILLGAARPVSSHGVGLADAITLAQHLERLPADLTVVLIEGSSFGHLDPLSAVVRHAGILVVQRLLVADVVDDPLSRWWHRPSARPRRPARPGRRWQSS